MKCAVVVLLLAFVASTSAFYPFWKVFCEQIPIYRGRADPIKQPGVFSAHSHRVFGANNFNIGDPKRTPLEEFDLLQKSNCTTCSISIDKTNYWVPDLYYKWPDGTFSLVPTGGLTVYYPARSGTGNQANPDWKAFPPGFRMTAGDPLRRSYNATSMRDQAISFACLSGVPNPETPAFPKDVSACIDGLRAQVWFPMCWNGKDLDSPDHQSHVSYPIERVDNGNCPPTHPVRFPGVFYEVLFSITGFPKQNGYNPFVFACGDDTGYGYHGDFLNGWNHDIVQAAINDPSCDAVSTGNGNNVKACKSLAPYVQDGPGAPCMLNQPILNIEDLGMNHPITAMPGCNPVTHGPNPAQPCNVITPQASSGPTWQRFLLQPKNSSLFVGAVSTSVDLTASVRVPYYSEVWTINKVTGGWVFQSDLNGQYVTSPRGDPLRANKGSPSTWETFLFNKQSSGYYAITSLSNNNYISVWPDGTLHADSTTIGDKQLWSLVDPNKFIQQTSTVTHN